MFILVVGLVVVFVAGVLVGRRNKNSVEAAVAAAKEKAAEVKSKL